MRRLLILVALVALWIGAQDLVFQTETSAAGLPVAGWGLALLLAIAVGEILADVGLPRLTGYLLAGLALGPLGLNILTTPLGTPIGFLQDAALGVLALQAGHVLDLGRLRHLIRPTLEITLSNVIVLLVIGGAASFLVAPLVPGLEGQKLGGGALALLMSVMMVCASPVVTVAVMRDSQASGRFTDLALATTFALDLVALLLLGLAATGAQTLLGGDSGVNAGVLTPLYALGWSTVVGGLLCGVLLLAGLWTRSSHGLTLLVLLGGGAAVVHGPLSAEPVLSFAIAGVLARNLGGEHQRTMLRGSLRSLHLPAALVFFGSLGAQFVFPAHWGLLVAAATLFVARIGGLYLGSRLGARWAREESETKRHLWLGLVPQGGASMGFLAVAAAALPGLGRPLTDVVGAILVLNLLLGPIGLKVALHRAGALGRQQDGDDPEALESDDDQDAPDVAEDEEAVLATDPLQGLVAPEDPDLEQAWDQTRERLKQIRQRVQDEAVTRRLERVGKVLRSTAGQARHSLQTASEACGRQETTEGLRGVLQAHRDHLAVQLQKALTDLRPPASAEDVPMVVHLVATMTDELVAATTAEINAMETARHVGSIASDPSWVRVAKMIKRTLRGVERLFGRPTSIRQVPYRRIVRRVVAGELVADLDSMELLMGRAEFKVLRRMETLLRRADEALVDAMAEVESGRSPEEMKSWLQERQVDLREASQQAIDDGVLLEEEPLRRLSEMMSRALDRVARVSDDAGTFVVGESHLRFSSVAPGARASAAAAEHIRQGWQDKQQALIDRMVLWTRLIQLQKRLRDLAFNSALGPARRMHGRLGELLRDAQSRVGGVLAVLQGASGDRDAEIEVDPTGQIRGLVDDLNRRVARPVEGIAHRLRSGVVVDRLLAALDTVTGPLPAQMLLLSETAILALHRGHEDDELPMVVNVRRTSRAFFDRHVAVRLAEHMRALEVSADQVMGGVRDAIRLLEFELSRDVEDPEHNHELDADSAESLSLEGWVEILQAVVERLGQEIAQTGETSSALQSELSETESSAVEALWEQLQEEIEPTGAEVEVSGVWGTVGDIWLSWMQSAGVTALRARVDGWMSVLADIRGEGDPEIEESLHGPTRVRQELQRFFPEPDTLPYVYGKLFSLEATENEAFIVEREREVEFVRQRVQQGHGGGLIVVGERGCGRTSLLRVVLSNHSTTREILWLDADRPFSDRLQLLKWVGRSAGMKGHHIDVITVAAYLRKRDKVLVIDGLENLLDRSAGGLDALDALAELMTATRRSVTWLATAERGIWALLQEISPVADLFDEVVYLKPLTTEGITLAIQHRHALSGLNLKFTSPGGWSPSRLMEQVTRTPPERGMFRWIHEESQGNPRAALHLWTLSLERETERVLRVVYGLPLSLDMLATLPLRLAPVLLVCLQHGMLDVPHLHRAMGWSRLEAQTALNTLASMGLISQRPRSDGDLTWVIPAAVEPVVHRYLCQRGLLRADRRVQ